MNVSILAKCWFENYWGIHLQKTSSLSWCFLIFESSSDKNF